MVNFSILNKFFSSLAVIFLCPYRQGIRNIHWCYLNKFSSSFIPPQAFPPILSRFIIFICILYLLFTWQHSLQKKEGKRRTKAGKFFFFFLLLLPTNAHNILWWTLLRMMMITIIIMNIFFLRFFLSSDKWTLWSLRSTQAKKYATLK